MSGIGDQFSGEMLEQNSKRIPGAELPPLSALRGATPLQTLSSRGERTVKLLSLGGGHQYIRRRYGSGSVRRMIPYGWIRTEALSEVDRQVESLPDPEVVTERYLTHGEGVRIFSDDWAFERGFRVYAEMAEKSGIHMPAWRQDVDKEGKPVLYTEYINGKPVKEAPIEDRVELVKALGRFFWSNEDLVPLAEGLAEDGFMYDERNGGQILMVDIDPYLEERLVYDDKKTHRLCGAYTHRMKNLIMVWSEKMSPEEEMVNNKTELRRMAMAFLQGFYESIPEQFIEEDDLDVTRLRGLSDIHLVASGFQGNS